MKVENRYIYIILASLALAGSVAAGVFVYAGGYDTSALKQHTALVYQIMTTVRSRSVAVRSDFSTPDLDEVDWQNAGILQYENNCRQCHGAPGRPPDSFSLGMKPAPTAIVELARRRTPQEIYHVIEHGIKMTGMPAWAYRMSAAEMWQVVAVIKQVANMTHDDYDRLLRQARAQTTDGATAQTQNLLQRATAEESAFPQADKTGSQVSIGKVAFQQYNCVSCHVIPGITAARTNVGPPLEDVTRRSYIAGVLAYSDDNLIRWIQSPTAIDPDTLMPDLGVSEAHARAMLAYLKSVAQ